MWRIAWNNLYRDRTRLLIAVMGVSVSVALVAIQSGIFLGAVESASRLIEVADADIWIIPERAVSVEFSRTMPQRYKYQALSVQGVVRTGVLIVAPGTWRFTDGHQEPVFVVGIDPNDDWLQLNRYFPHDLRDDSAVLLDRKARGKIQFEGRPLKIGDVGEINGYQAQIVNFVDGMSAFVTSPYLYCRYGSALNYVGATWGDCTYVLVKCREGADLSQIKEQLQRRMTGVEVLTREEFSRRTWVYWIFGTGLGVGLSLSAVLAFVVGMAVVAQTMLTSVLAKLREFATLKAVGFGNGFVIGIVTLQSTIVASVGYFIGIGFMLIAAHQMANGGSAVAIQVSPVLILAMGPIALFMCLLASMAALLKALVVPPAKVFR